MKENQPPEQVPDRRHGDKKEFKSQHGFKVVWFNADELSQEIKPGIYIRVYKPDGVKKAEAFFAFGKEAAAEQDYQAQIEKIKAWDNIKK